MLVSQLLLISLRSQALGTGALTWTKLWDLEPLRAPSWYSHRRRTPLTQWTEAGKAYLTELKSDPRRELPAPRAVIHFVVCGQVNSSDYICFPDIPATSLLRHAYIMRRQAVHHIPQPEKTPLPRGGMDPEERAKLFSVYLRPWTLSDVFASAHVPHLKNLNV